MKKEVVFIGAGISGLTGAALLAKNNCTRNNRRH